MQTYRDLAELAQICAKQARFTTSRDVAHELWQLAQEYQKRAAEIDSGRPPDIGPPPSWLTE
jgi:hypothetical protein